MTQFSSVTNFQGNWSGSYDGRPAQLQIQTLQAAGSSTQFYVSLEFTDFAGSIWVSSVDVGHHFDVDDHVLTGTTLRPFRGDGPDLHWPRLFIFTWDIDRLAGYSTWDGKDYGMSWSRAQP